MAKHPLAMALAKVIIAAAWADGHLATDEVNALKNLLSEMGQLGGYGEMALTAEEWAELEIYLYSPVEAAERQRLIDNLAATLRGPGDRSLALAAIERLFGADRVHTDEERRVAAEIRAALLGVDLGPIALIGRLVRAALRPPTPAPNREQHMEEFLHNRIYYAVRQRLGKAPEEDLGIPAAEARKLALAGGLLAEVARIDQQVSDAEADSVTTALAAGWQISPTGAAVVSAAALAESADGLDFYRLCEEFANSTTVEERIHFLDALFAVAAADGAISSEESAAISRITYSIKLPHDQFVAAKRRAR